MIGANRKFLRSLRCGLDFNIMKEEGRNFTKEAFILWFWSRSISIFSQTQIPRVICVLPKKQVKQSCMNSKREKSMIAQFVCCGERWIIFSTGWRFTFSFRAGAHLSVDLHILSCVKSGGSSFVLEFSSTVSTCLRRPPSSEHESKSKSQASPVRDGAGQSRASTQNWINQHHTKEDLKVQQTDTDTAFIHICMLEIGLA